MTSDFASLNEGTISKGSTLKRKDLLLQEQEQILSFKG